MISNIKIHNVATFSPDEVQIEDLKKINFIYGSNATGKTTISTLLAKPLEEPFKFCAINWKNEQQLQCLVFNRTFKEENFGKSHLEGVFTLGKATKDELEVIEKKQTELGVIKAEGIRKSETLKQQKEKLSAIEEQFKEDIWKTVFKKHESLFRDALQGSLKKDQFRQNLLKEFANNNSALQSIGLLEEKGKTVLGEVPEKITPITIPSAKCIIDIETIPVWEKRIVGKSDVNIGKLIQKLGASDWINQGRTYIDGSVCPFCQQKTISDDFRHQLEEFFDSSFTEAVELIGQKSKDYKILSETLESDLGKIDAFLKITPLSNIDTKAFSAAFNSLITQLKANQELIESKKKELSRSIQLSYTESLFKTLEDFLKDANLKITEHNRIAQNFEAEKAIFVSEVWKFLLEEGRVTIESFKKQEHGFKTGITKLEKDVEEKLLAYVELNSEIQKLSKNVTSIQPTVDEINRTLKSCGFLTFEIAPSEKEKNKYQIRRHDGSLAESTLSEGEISFITFLYFLQLAKGATNQDAISAERVLVIDDPISSLDSDVLFTVSTLLKGLINQVKSGQGNIKQIIVLTHNVYFHKEASFIDCRTSKCKDTNYWILRKKGTSTFIQSFGMDNPIKTSYELLWKEIQNRNQNSGITIQNSMRRIIENYFKTLGKFGDEEIIMKFETKEEQEVCRSLLSWINDGSHSISDDLFVQLQEDSIDKYLEVFKKIFVLTNHEAHYEMMMNN